MSARLVGSGCGAVAPDVDGGGDAAFADDESVDSDYNLGDEAFAALDAPLLSGFLRCTAEHRTAEHATAAQRT